MLMIKHKKINWFRLSILSSFILTSFCGCSTKSDNTKKEDTSSSVFIESSIYESSNTFETDSEESLITENANLISDESIFQSNSSSNLNESVYEKLEINESNIDSIYQSIDDIINIENRIYNNTSIDKERLIIDYEKVYNFIFNDGSIKGHFFADLNKEDKARTIDFFMNFDLQLDDIFPDSVADIKKAVGYSKDIVVKKLKQLKIELGDCISSTIGEDKYNSYIEEKDKVIDTAKNQLLSDVSDLKEFGKNIWQKIKKR